MGYPLEKYRFYRSGNKIIAVSTYEGKAVRGVAICHPEDEFDELAGRKIAAARCNLRIAEKRAARSDRKVKEAINDLVTARDHLTDMLEYQEDAKRKVIEAYQELDKLTF